MRVKRILKTGPFSGARCILSVCITDESRLSRRFYRQMTAWKLVGVAAALCLGLMALGGAVVWMSPLRRLMPGYLDKEERTATEMAWLRADSLSRALSDQQRYLDNFARVLRGIPAEGSGTAPSADSLPAAAPAMDVDSLLMRSESEERFVAAIERRERFNYSVLAPLAAEGMVFHYPATAGVYVSHPTDSRIARMLLPRDASIRAAAEGTVVGVTRSVRERGYIVWIQHDNGFLTRYSRLGTPLVDQGSHVEGGEAIAIPARNTGSASEAADIQLWHDSQQLPARRYLPER